MKFGDQSAGKELLLAQMAQRSAVIVADYLILFNKQALLLERCDDVIGKRIGTRSLLSTTLYEYEKRMCHKLL